MKTALVILWAVMLASFGSSVYAGYRVERVVEIGPGGGPIVGTMQWSPDGTQLAYFADGYLMVSDTLGNSRQVVKLEGRVRRFVWLDNDRVAVYEEILAERAGRTATINTINIQTGEHQELDRFVKQPGEGWSQVTRSFDGPYLTLEGIAYYATHTGEYGKPARQVTRRLIEYSPGMPQGGLHILRTYPTGVYEIDLLGQDSVKLADLPDWADPVYLGLYPTQISRDRQYILNDAMLFDFAKSTWINLTPPKDEFPDGTRSCSFVRSWLNPARNEVVGLIDCWDGESYVVERTGIYDIETASMTILDTLVNLPSCLNPCYSPDGRKIAFFSEGKGYILCREEM